jgi:hypothetical protein
VIAEVVREPGKNRGLSRYVKQWQISVVACKGKRTWCAGSGDDVAPIGAIPEGTDADLLKPLFVLRLPFGLVQYNAWI